MHVRFTLKECGRGKALILLCSFHLLASCSGSGKEAPPQSKRPAIEVAAQTLPKGAPPVALVTQAALSEPTRAEVPLEADGGTFAIPVTINNTISLKFTIDSGAADVTIPSDVASTLVRAGTISADDYVGSQTFVLADGSVVPSPEFRIRSLRVGRVVLHNIVASITGTNGSLLLGQTFLKQLKSWSIDNDKHILRLEAGTAGSASTWPQAAPSEASVASSSPSSTENIAASSPEAAELAASSRDTIKRYFAAWSDSSDPDGSSVGQYYGDPVSFYGKQLDLNRLMSEQKLPFARRWPVRSYSVEPNSLQVQCAPESHSCRVAGIVDWNVSNPTNFRHARGVARFSLLLVDGRIVGEGGKVLSRN